jgi:hypothetical protein
MESLSLFEHAAQTQAPTTPPGWCTCRHYDNPHAPRVDCADTAREEADQRRMERRAARARQCACGTLYTSAGDKCRACTVRAQRGRA